MLPQQQPHQITSSSHRLPYSMVVEHSSPAAQSNGEVMVHRKSVEGMVAWPTGYYGTDGLPAYDRPPMLTEDRQVIVRRPPEPAPANLPMPGLIPSGNYEAMLRKSPNMNTGRLVQQQVSSFECCFYFNIPAS